MQRLLSIALSCLFAGSLFSQEYKKKEGVEIVVLGTIQDGGSPHIACIKDCCRNLFLRPVIDRKVVCLGVVDHQHKKSYLFESTPDMPSQLKHLKRTCSWDSAEIPNGVFLTHAHIGHYSGIMYFGKESMNSSNVSVYAMPRMKEFLCNNGPWDMLVNNGNIKIQELFNGKEVILNESLSVTPILVPHRDEYSETVGYFIKGPNKTAVFIPDIDKWSKWEVDLKEVLSYVDFAILDGTFYDGEEINNRDLSLIPHPFIIESIELLNKVSMKDKNKVHFIHFNHTNPIIKNESGILRIIEEQGYNVANYGDVFKL